MMQVVVSATSDLLEASSEYLSSITKWPDSSTALAYLILRKTSNQLPNFIKLPVNFPIKGSLRHTPELATYGYLLGTASDQDINVWLDAIDHLRGRDIFPQDRQSFIYNPVEVLGIANGLSLQDIKDDRRTWFIDIIRRGFSTQQFRSPMSILSAHIALRLLDPNISENQNIDNIELSHLSLGEIILVMGIDFAFPNLSPVAPTDLEYELLDKVLTQRITINDAVEAATIYAFSLRVKTQLLAPQSIIDDFEKIIILCRRFPLFANTMRARQKGRNPFIVSDEYDVQDLLHAILRLHYDDVRPEEYSPSYAGKHSRVDFFLPRERMIIEAKMTRKGLGQKEVIDQLLIDVGRYSKVERVDNLVCIIYDPERYCTNPKAIEDDVENSGGRLKVRVVVCPQGI